jgi:polysaccharide export outer membrane protein
MWRTLYNTKWFAVSAGTAGVQGGTLSSVRRRLALCLPVLAAASALLAGQAQTTQQAPPPPEKPPAATKTLPNSVSPDNTGAAIDPKTYVIGPEDVLFISVFREPDLSGSVGVRPDGKITKPLIGDMQAGGLTPERLAAQLKQAFSSFIKEPDVQVTVAQVNSKWYTIAGEVTRPGRYPLVLPTTVFEALSNVGFRDFANTKKIVIMRGAERIKFNYNEVLKGKHLEQNILLQPSDTIYVK